MSRIRIGTRGSALALTQSRWVAAQIAAVTGREPEIVVVRTSGDAFVEQSLASFGGVGAFTLEIDAQQRAGAFEVSVHSLKDLPTKGREGLLLAAVPARAPVEDCVVTRAGCTLADLPRGASVATGSARRSAQLLRLRPDLRIASLRGNVDTRIRRVREGAADATLLARAGLVRLGLEHESSEVIGLARMVPAAGQGALAVVVREDAAAALSAVRSLEDPESRAETDAERAVLEALGAGCHMPLGVLARARKGRIRMVARVVSPDGRRVVEHFAGGPQTRAVSVGVLLGRRMLESGAAELLAQASHAAPGPVSAAPAL